MEYMVARIGAYPLTSEAALKLAVVDLDPRLKAAATKNLWRSAENELIPAFPGLSLDELVVIRDATWFRGATTSTPPTLADALKAVSSGLDPTGTREEAPDERGDRRRLRWLMFVLPLDLLTAADSGWIRRFRPVSPALGRALARDGFAEIHLHLGAAPDFGSFWCLTQYALLREHRLRRVFHSPGAPFDEGRTMEAWLLRGALARAVLAHHLAGDRSLSLRDFLRKVALPWIARKAGLGMATSLEGALRDLASGRLRKQPATPATLRHLARLLTGFLPHGQGDPRRGSADAEQLVALDPLARVTSGFARANETPESALLRAVLEQAALPGGLDEMTARLFWQMVRIRNIFYQHVVQRPLTPGLQWFIRFYERLDAIVDHAELPSLIASALTASGHGQGLRCLEVRKAPAADSRKLLKLVRADPRARRAGEIRASRADPPQEPPRAPSGGNHDDARRSKMPEFGVVFHFPRERGGAARQGLPAAFGRSGNADPGSDANAQGFRFGGFYQKMRRRAMALRWLLTHYPCSLQVVRGLDVCTDELGVPTWVFVPLLTGLRHVAHRSADLLAGRYRQAREPLELRTTAHAGEDFVHILGGLRRIEETVRFLDLREGDRLGHAVALGIDAAAWARRVGRVALPLEERLLDLVWEWDWYCRRKSDPPVARLAYLEREIPALSGRLFGQQSKEPLDPMSVRQLVEALYEPARLRETGFPTSWRAMEGSDGLAVRLRRYLTSQAIFQRGQKILWIDTGPEAAELERLQADVRREVARRGLVVEVNPSSNLLIANLGDLERHPLWRLAPPAGPPKAPALRVCLGSDNPLTFSTRLREEYQLLLDALRDGGVDEPEAMRWLDAVRLTGLDSSFAVGRFADVDSWIAPQPSRVFFV